MAQINAFTIVVVDAPLLILIPLDIAHPLEYNLTVIGLFNNFIYIRIMNGMTKQAGGFFATSAFVVVLLVAGGIGIVPGVSYAQVDYSSDPVYDYSSNPVLDYSSAPFYDYSSNPVPDYSSAPLYDYSSNPVLDYSSNPVYDYSSNPVYDYSSDPVRDYSSNPVYDYSSDPMRDYSYDPMYGYFEASADNYYSVGSDGALYTYDRPSYGGGSSGGSYSSGSYSSGGSTYSRPSTVTISSPKVSFTPTTIGYPVTIGYPTTIAKPANTTITKPAKTTGAGAYTSYYTDNSINDSYNVTTITKVTDKQQTIQYVYTPSCSIYATPNSISANQAVTLTWSSQNANTAYLTNHGSVLVSGSLSVNPSQTTTYSLLAYSASGQAANCQTTVYVNQTTSTQYPSCTLSANPSYIQNGAYSILSWTSQNAVSARLSDGLGNVALNGSLSVRPESNRAYSLTVTDAQGRTNVCTSNVVVSGSYISLSQIPYTGFDFGPFGNAMYWLMLLMLGGGSAYFMLFYRGGMVNVIRETFSMLVPSTAGVSGAAIQANTYSEEVNEGSRNEHRVSVEDLPVRQSEAVRATKDAMTVIKSKTGEAPRIVISRN